MKFRLAMICCASLTILGCASDPLRVPKTLPTAEVVETVVTDADRLLQYYAYISGLQGESLRREFHRVQKAFHADPNEFNQMQLTLLLTSPSATFRDTEHAHALIASWLQEEFNTYSKLHPLALLYDSYLFELNRSNEQLRQNQDKLLQAEDRIEQLQKSLESEKQRANALQKKLNALVDIEKTLIERD